MPRFALAGADFQDEKAVILAELYRKAEAWEPLARHLTRVLEENKRTEAELRSIGTHLRESGDGREECQEHSESHRPV